MYTLDTDPDAQQQVEALPAHALDAYAEARTVLELTPWTGEPYNQNAPDAPMRLRTFGTVAMIIYLILDDQRRVDILRVIWAG